MNSQISEQVKELVIARLETLPAGAKLSIGSHGSFNKAEMISHVNAGDTIGKKIADIEMEFLRALKEGKLYE